MSATPNAYRVVVGTSPTLLAETEAVGLAVLIRNSDDTLSIFVGGSAVTTSDGFEVIPREGLGLTLGHDGLNTQSLYAVAASNVTVDVIVRLAD